MHQYLNFLFLLVVLMSLKNKAEEQNHFTMLQGPWQLLDSSKLYFGYQNNTAYKDPQ